MKVKLISHSQPTSSTSFDYGWRTLEDVILQECQIPQIKIIVKLVQNFYNI